MEMKTTRTRLLAVLCLTLLLVSHSVEAILITDDFDDNSINEDIWVVADGNPEEKGGKMVLHSAGTALQRLATVESFSDEQDFAVEVDFSDFEEPNNGETSLRMTATNGSWDCWLNRENWGTSQIRLVVDNPPGNRTVSLVQQISAQSGKLKLIYHLDDECIEGMYDIGDGWVSIGDTSSDEIDFGPGFRIDLRNWSGGAAGMTIKYDNFKAYDEDGLAELEKVTQAVDPKDKLATTWAELRK